jgi:two-component system phosphate regulon sensor histidine kinase PhoR
MRKHKTLLLTACISALLVSLIIIQLAWLKHASLSEQMELDLRIEKALGRTEDQLKNLNYCVVSYSKVFVNPGESFFILHSDGNKTDTVDIFFDPEYSTTGEVIKRHSMNFQFPFSTDIQFTSTAVITDTTDYNSERQEFSKRLTGKEFSDILTTNRAIDSVFDMHLLDSLIASNLKDEKVDTVYGFGLIENNTGHIAFASRIEDSASLMASPFTRLLFRDNKFIKPYRLGLLFPKVPSLAGLKSWLWFSVVIILLLTFSFYVFIKVHRRQTKLSEMKTDFINNLTHELNTPMANISLAIETLENNGHSGDPKLKNILHIISSEFFRLRGNIERSLQIATLEKGTMQLRKKIFNLSETVNAVASSYKLQCEQLAGNLNFSADKSAFIIGDEIHLLNCIVNLVDNAIKYRKGPPEISLSVEEKNNGVELAVSDNGIGMDSETQKHIFEKFYRAHEGDTHNTKGFGLGLSYVKSIVEAHGGTIEMQSKKGIGTTFTIKLQKANV